jgi:hypothetical protein
MSRVTYRIHPGLGFARVGDAPRGPKEGQGWYVGPEVPGEHPRRAENGGIGPFKSDGKVLARGARFRIFAYGESGPPREVHIGAPGEDVVKVEWTVEVANRKATFFKFLGPLGMRGPYGSLLFRLPWVRRNASRTGALRDALVQSTTPTSIASGATTPVELRNECELTKGAIPVLGDLRVDAQGNLIVCGGYGRAVYLPELNGGALRDGSLSDFANNDGWFDDIADGPVQATLTLQDGSRVRIEGDDAAWVASAPPDFAPGLRPIRSMWDTLVDLYVRTRPGELRSAREFQGSPWLEMAAEWEKTGSLGDFVPKFTRDIYPILRAAAGIPSVFSVRSRPIAHHRFDDALLAQLGGPGSLGSAREAVFRRMRHPGNRAYDLTLMPLLNGDDWPPHVPEGYPVLAPLMRLAARWRIFEKPFAVLSPLQYALLERWAQGRFEEDWHGPPPTAPPSALDRDRAALETAVGGAFFPGIEASWLLADGHLFGGVLRVKSRDSQASDVPILREHSAIGPIRFQPGIVTAQMALPWHADFASCRKTPSLNGELDVGWWPTQRPDDVFVKGPSGELVPKRWAGPIDDAPAAERHLAMVQGWSSHGFVIDEDGDLFEQP